MRTCIRCQRTHCHTKGLHGLPCDCACHRWTPRSKVIKEPQLPGPKFYLAWATLTKNPSISNEELAAVLSLKDPKDAYYWRLQLEKHGVIEIMRDQERACRVLIPFVQKTNE